MKLPGTILVLIVTALSLSAPPGKGGEPNEPRIPPDLIEVSDACYAPLDHLAPGSREAQDRQRQAVQELGLPLEVKTAKAGIVFRLIPAGSFTMGSPSTEAGRSIGGEETQHQVTLTKPFYCGKYEVTQGQWEQVMGSNPSEFKNAGPDAPVETVSWEDCQAFLKKLCELEGVPEGTYRLLTEAEWEYACRAGTTTALYNGELVILGWLNAPALDPIAWYGGNSGVAYADGWDSSRWEEKQYNHQSAGTHPVGQKLANGYGLYDMIGNVWEWCQDWYAESYPDGPVTDPLGPASSSVDRTGVNLHVIRGGSWQFELWPCRSAGRIGSLRRGDSSTVGLRIARTIPSCP